MRARSTPRLPLPPSTPAGRGVGSSSEVVDAAHVFTRELRWGVLINATIDRGVFASFSRVEHGAGRAWRGWPRRWPNQRKPLIYLDGVRLGSATTRSVRSVACNSSSFFHSSMVGGRSSK